MLLFIFTIEGKEAFHGGRKAIPIIYFGILDCLML
jgi:hypothetical protein